MADRSHRREPTRLSKRELEVLGLLAAGLTDREIGERLSLSARTVNHHVSAICAKLGARRRTDAVAVGLARGLITPGSDPPSR